MTKCCKCGDVSYGYHYLVDHEYWCSRCLPEEVERLRHLLEPSQALLQEAVEIWDSGDTYEVVWDEWIERARAVGGVK